MSKLIDLTDQNFGYWHVLRRSQNNKNGKTQWVCECTACNKTIKEVYGTHLRSRSSTNCGCIRKEKFRQMSIKQEAGKIYGHLKVIREVPLEERPRQDRQGVYWYCDCLNCGRKNVPVFGDYLRNGDTISCGCIVSKNESKISQMLDSLNLQYKQHYSFKDLYSRRTCDKLIFDFAIFNDNQLLYLIEYDGIQHFNNYDNSLWDTQTTHNNDVLKNEYCFQHNIPLIRIPYNKTYTLSDLKLETTSFLLTQENVEQYYNR